MIFLQHFLTIRNLQPNIIFLKMAKTRHQKNQCRGLLRSLDIYLVSGRCAR